ncbi:hypothetical protein [Haloglomus litoreum]|uniref:hypothetical protein n=1 Tax=Haloglomus litoreum TaxID=3034026 RepID=UPI0023E7E0A5|nr:hypothetical protein [Haloglomus sp. DT116]
MTHKLIALALAAAAILAVGTGGVAAAPDAGTDTDASTTDDPVEIDLDEWTADDEGADYDRKLTGDESFSHDLDEDDLTHQGDGVYTIDVDDDEA